MNASWGFDLARSLPKGSTLYVVLRHVSHSRMLRTLDVFAIVGDRVQPVLIPQLPCFNEHRAEYVQRGCGYDVGRDLVATIGAFVHGDPAYFQPDWL